MDFFMGRLRNEGAGRIARRAIARARGILSAIRGREDDPDAFLRRVRGLVHVGANTGQERESYASHGLSVIWVEPIGDVFDR